MLFRSTDKTIAKEFIQKEANPNKIATEVFKLLADTAYKAELKADQAALKASLGNGQASEAVAKIARQLLSKS